MAKYIVTRAWHGVKVDDVVDLDRLHPSLAPNVRPLKGEGGQIDPATQPRTAPSKGDIAKRLKELGIEFDGRKGAEELAALLPDDDPLKPKPE